MQLYRTNRSRKKRIFEAFAKQIQARINRAVLRDRVHLHTDFLPFIIIALCSVTDAFGTRSRHLTAACAPVTFRTCLAVISDASSRRFDTLCIVHCNTFFL